MTGSDRVQATHATRTSTVHEADRIPLDGALLGYAAMLPIVAGAVAVWVAALIGPCAAQGTPPAPLPSGSQQDATSRSVEAICREAEPTVVPEEPDAPAGRRAEPPCDAEALYYGIGRAPDPKAALHCAARHVRDDAPER